MEDTAMTTEKQREANRLNALNSTGPQTPEGKAKVAQNAVKHGLLAEHILIRDENPEDYEAFRDTMADNLQPEGSVESLLAERIITAAWRLRRAVRLERDVIHCEVESKMQDRRQFPMLHKGEPEPTPSNVATDTIRNTDAYGKLSRYEAHLERSMYRALHELQRLQVARHNNVDVAPPAALDVTVHGLPESE